MREMYRQDLNPNQSKAIVCFFIPLTFFTSCFVFQDVHEIFCGSDWQDSLNYAVSNCEVFVPLVTPRYGETQWTNREVGMVSFLYFFSWFFWGWGLFVFPFTCLASAGFSFVNLVKMIRSCLWSWLPSCWQEMFFVLVAGFHSLSFYHTPYFSQMLLPFLVCR